MSEQVMLRNLHVSLPSLVEMAETGMLRPAAFSRPHVWSSRQVADLFDSIFRGYPIGTLLVIEQPADEEDVLLGDILIHAPGDDHAMVLIDGLQRVTAIVGALAGPQGRSSADRFQVCYDIRNDKFGAGPPGNTFMLPVHVAADSHALAAWMRDHPFLSDSDLNACWRLSGAIRTYAVPMIILSGAEAWQTAQEIFTRINASGAPLTRSDIARARSGQAIVIKDGLNKLQAEIERSGFGQTTLDLVAQCALAVVQEGSNPVRRRPIWTRPSQSFAQLPQPLQEEAVERAQTALIPVTTFLRQECSVPHIKLLPQRSILPTLTWFVDNYGPPQGRTQELLRRWTWRCGTVSGDFQLELSFAQATNSTAISEATKLLDSLPSPDGGHWTPDMSIAGLNKTNGRLNALALLSLRPHLLVPLGDIMDIDDVLITTPSVLIPWLDNASSAFIELLPWKFTDRRPSSLGGYLLHPPADQRRLMEAVTGIDSTDISSLAGHCIDRTSLALLKQGDFDTFVEYREQQMREVILKRVQSMARWGFRDHGRLPSISDRSEYADGYHDEY